MLLTVADLDPHAPDRGSVVRRNEALHRAILDGAHIGERQQPAADMAFQHRTRGQQPDHVARHRFQRHAMPDPTDIADDIAASAAGSDHLVGPAGKEVLDHFATACQKSVSVAPLRHALARDVGDREMIPLQHRDLIVEVRQRPRGQQAAHAGADDDGVLADPCHVMLPPLGLSRIGTIWGRQRLYGSWAPAFTNASMDAVQGIAGAPRGDAARIDASRRSLPKLTSAATFKFRSVHSAHSPSELQSQSRTRIKDSLVLL